MGRCVGKGTGYPPPPPPANGPRCCSAPAHWPRTAGPQALHTLQWRKGLVAAIPLTALRNGWMDG